MTRFCNVTISPTHLPSATSPFRPSPHTTLHVMLEDHKYYISPLHSSPSNTCSPINPVYPLYPQTTTPLPRPALAPIFTSRLATQTASYNHSYPITPYSNAHWFSLRTSSSSSGVKSFLMLNVFRISSGVFPFIISATVWHVKSNRFLMFR